MTSARSVELFTPGLRFELSATSNSRGIVLNGAPVMRTGAAPISKTGSRKVASRRRQGFASASVALHESVMSAPQAPVSAKVRPLCHHHHRSLASVSGTLEMGSMMA